MKRVGGLFDAVWPYDNLLLASQRAQMGERYRPDVLAFNFRREDRLHRLSSTLHDGTWQRHGYRHFEIFEPKRRWNLGRTVCRSCGASRCWANRGAPSIRPTRVRTVSLPLRDGLFRRNVRASSA